MASSGRVQAPELNNLDLLDPPRRNQLIPVETYVAPQQAGNSTFGQLAQALAKVHPEINDLINQQDQTYEKGQAQQAHDQALQTGLAWKDAVASGKVSPDQSPYFVRAWKELDGQNQADQISSSIQQAYASDPIKNSADPQAMSQWLSQQIAGGLQNVTDPDTLAGATQKLQAFKNEMLQAQARQATENAVTGMSNSAGTQLGNTVDQYLSAVKAGKTQYSSVDLANLLQGPNGMAKFGGLDTKTSDAVYLQTVIDKAKQYADPRLLDVLKQSRPDINDPTKTVGGPGTTAEGMARVIDAQREIKSLALQQQNQQYELQEHQRTLAAQNLSSSIFSGFQKTGQFDPDAITQLGKVDATAAMKILEFQGALRRENQQMDPAQFAQTWNQQVMTPDPNGKSAVQRVTDLIASHQLVGSTENVQTWLGKAQEIDQAGVQAWKPVQDVITAIQHDGTDPTASVSPIFKDGDAKLAVQGLFMQKALEIQKANPGVAPEALNQQILQAYDQAKDEYAKLYPSKINLGGTKEAHASSLDFTPAAAPAEPEATQNGGMPSQFSAPSPDDVMQLQKDAANPAARKFFTDKYGPRALQNALKGIK